LQPRANARQLPARSWKSPSFKGDWWRNDPPDNRFRQASWYQDLSTPNDANILSRAIMRILDMTYDWKGVRTRRIRRFKLGLSSLIALAVVALPFVWPVVN
jgi:hypothetical protein